MKRSFDLHLDAERLFGVIDELQGGYTGVTLAIRNGDCGQGIPKTDQYFLLIHKAPNVLGKRFWIRDGLRELNDAAFPNSVGYRMVSGLDTLGGLPGI